MPLCTPTQHNNKGKQTKKRIFQREIAKKSTSQKSRNNAISSENSQNILQEVADFIGELSLSGNRSKMDNGRGTQCI
jgi:hypothetical protein